ncbi:MAG: hypothetical protein CFE24_09810 [Flavobacterium sp. BFFFF2]|nr:MAG: hypothetical protein CFE24_09810 [Flavobacterium sp. BFFFF2]
MKKIILLVILQITCFAFGQAPTIEWQKCLGGIYEDSASCIQQTSDGGYILAGHTGSNNVDVSGNHGLFDIWIVKLNNLGAIQWQKCLGGSDSDEAFSIQQTLDGGYIIAGRTDSNNGDIIGNHGLNDFLVIKLNNLGSIEWQKCLGGSGQDHARSIQQTNDGGYIVTGWAGSNNGNVTGSHGGGDIWVVKLNDVGVIVWQKCLGGSGYEFANSIQQTTDGGYIIAGSTFSNDGDVSGNHGGSDFWIVKLNNLGIIDWQKCLGVDSVDYATCIKQTTDNGYIVAGYTGSDGGTVSGHHGQDDIWVLKLNISGTLMWQKILGGNSQDKAGNIQQTSDGGYIVAGYTGSNNGDVIGNNGSTDAWVVKLNELGTIMWQKCFGGSSDDNANSIQQTTDGGYVMAGFSSSSDGDVSGNIGNADFWIVKLNAEIVSTPPPIANPQSFCDPSTVGNLMATGQNLKWYDLATGGTVLLSSVALVTGTYYVSQTVNGVESARTSVSITVNPTVTPTFSEIAPICIGSSFILPNNSNNAISGTWSPAVDNTTTTTYIFTPSIGQCATTQAMTVTVNPQPAQPTTACYQTATFNTSTCSWDVTGTQPTQPPTACYETATFNTSTCTWDVTGSAPATPTGQAVQNVTVPNAPNATLANLVVSPSNAVWYASLADALAGTNALQNTTVLTNGTTYYAVNYVGICPSTPFAVTVNVTLKSDSFVAFSVRLFPNSASSVIYLQTSNNLEVDRITIYDLMGKLILTQSIKNTQVDVMKLAAGMYILEAFSGEEKFLSKFVKE